MGYSIKNPPAIGAPVAPLPASAASGHFGVLLRPPAAPGTGSRLAPDFTGQNEKLM